MHASLMLAALLGMVLGTALQLQQPSLWDWTAYAAMLLGGLLAWAGLALSARRARWRAAWVLLALASVAWGLTGLRGVMLQHDTLAAELEGRDLVVVGVVAAMPQRLDTGLRFRFDLESAELAGERVRLPPKLYLSWYAPAPIDAEPLAGAEPALPAPPGELRAGERWRLTVRLKAPHGNLNPHGFDYELWL